MGLKSWLGINSSSQNETVDENEQEEKKFGEVDDIPDLDDMINALGCTKEYWEMDDCMDTHHQWSACQEQVKIFKQCWESSDKKKEVDLKQLMLRQMK